GCGPAQMLVASTGVIGRLLPMAVFETGVPAAALDLGDTPAHLDRAARAILTTDTVVKIQTRPLPNGAVTGIAKGAAMIGPNMATMLGFVMSDAAVTPTDLQTVLRRAVDRSFNRISVEGHTSTNDSVLLFANGQGQPLSGPALAEFEAAVTDVCAGLARAIA